MTTTNVTSTTNLRDLLSGLASGVGIDEPITNKVWRIHRNIDLNTASQELQRLVKEGVLRQEGRKRGTKYFIVLPVE